MISISDIHNTLTYKSLKSILSYKTYYEEHNSPEEILDIVSLDMEEFNRVVCRIVKEIYKLDSSIQIIPARYFIGKNDCFWSNIQNNCKYTVFALVEFSGIQVWYVNTSDLFESNIMYYNHYQKWHAKKSDIEEFLRPISDLITDKLMSANSTLAKI